MQTSPSSLLAQDGPIVALLRQRVPGLMAVYAFGSQVQGTAGPHSDLDRLVVGCPAGGPV